MHPVKRFLAAAISFSLLLVSAPLAAWSQVSAVMTGASSAVSGSAAGAAATSSIPRLSMPVTNLMASSLSGALSVPLSNAPIPAGLQPAVLSPVTVDAKSLAAARFEVAGAVEAILKGPVFDSRSAASIMMSRLLGIEEAHGRKPIVAGILNADSQSPGLIQGAFQPAGLRAPVPPPNINGPRRSKLGGAIKMVATVAAGAGVTLGLQIAAVALLPAVFGVMPVAAVWAVSSGLLLFPLALYARYRLAKRDSPRLNKVKTILDFALGAFIGACAVAVPSLGVVLPSVGLMTAALPLASVAGGRWFGRSALADSVLTWTMLTVVPALVGVASVAGLISLSPLIGLMALPVMTTIAFFLGRLINSAETGAPFAVLGAIQKIRFPSFQWVMIGVVFGLLTGFGSVHTNIAFIAWSLLGSRTIKWDKGVSIFKNISGLLMNFDVLYLGLLAFTAVTAFSSPLTFLVIAFSGERAAVWTERLLARILPKSAASPSTMKVPVADPDILVDRPPKWPAFHYMAKSVVMLGVMAGAGVLLAVTVFGITSLLTNLGIASVLAFIPFFFAKNIIKLLMRAETTTKEQDPEFFKIMEGLRGKINAGRRAKGKKEIPMPEMVIDPMGAPNAYATGRSPFSAMVGVTKGIKAMTLDPEIVRDGVVRLITSSDAGTKEFKVFRLAIAGSVAGIPVDATPSQVAAVVLKADRVELKALGVRMLRGVLSHEFSHVMDRHMLSGSIGGAIASGVAFASYGVMWAVSHAKILVGKALGLRTKTAPVDALAVRSDGSGVRPEALDPISVGIILKSLPALIRLFAALWTPVVLQILQMASSRNNEGMADEDGALLSEDPQSLALALGLLTTWRPAADFRLPGAAVPRAASMQHIMIVNPLEQLENAGELARPSASGGPTRADDLIFELFITHPNTGVRIRKLHDMSQATKGVRPAKPRPPDTGGGGPHISFVPQVGPASENIGGGLLRRAWAKLKSCLRVLPEEDRNRQFWIYTAGQALMMLGVNFHYTALPKLVAPTKADAAKLGYNRAINWGAQAGASLSTGPLIDRTSTQKVIIWTYIGRSIMMLLVPVLFFQGFLGFGVFAGLIAGAGFLNMAGTTASSVAINRILADDVDHYNRANAILTIVMNVVGILGPLLAGVFIATLNAYYGLLSGNALSYAVYGVLLAACAVGYGIFLKLPRDEMMAARRELAQILKRDGVGGAVYRGVTGGQVEGRKTILVEVDGDLALASGVPVEFGGFPVKVVARRRILKEIAAGFKAIFSNRFLRLYLFSMMLSVTASDVLIFAAIPRFLEDVLHSGAGSFGLFLATAALGSGLARASWPSRAIPSGWRWPLGARVPLELAARESFLDDKTLDAAAQALRGTVPAVFARYRDEWAKGGAARASEQFGADLVAEGANAVGGALGRTEAEAADLLEMMSAASDLRAWASLRGAKLLADAHADALKGMDRLQHQGKWTSWLHGLSGLVYAALFFAGNLHLAAALMLFSSILAAPAIVTWTSLTTKVVSDSYHESQGKIYSAMFFCSLIFSIGGVLLYGGLVTMLPTMTLLWILGGVLVLCSLFDFILPALIFPINRKR